MYSCPIDPDSKVVTDSMDVEDYPCQKINDLLTMCLDERGGDWRQCKEALEELRKCHQSINKSNKK